MGRYSCSSLPCLSIGLRGVGLHLAVQSLSQSRLCFCKSWMASVWAGRDSQGHIKSLLSFRLLLGQLSLSFFQHNNINSLSNNCVSQSLIFAWRLTGWVLPSQIESVTAIYSSGCECLKQTENFRVNSEFVVSCGSHQEFG